MFYGQNCSGRLGEKKTVICVVGSKEDINFAKFIRDLDLKNIKKELNEKNFLEALELAKKYKILVSIIEISSDQFNSWKRLLSNYPHWFAKLYGIICYHALKPVINDGYIQLDKEYDQKTLETAVRTLLSLIDNKVDIYLRKEHEYPTNRIIVADLFARGYFRKFNCTGLIINRDIIIKNETQKVFRK